jgi:hypothetical protein
VEGAIGCPHHRLRCYCVKILGTHSGVSEDSSLLSCDTVSLGEKYVMF